MSTPSPANGRILIGEDVRVVAFKMAQALERAGYAVETAGDGEECLRKAHKTPPDLIVLDLTTARMRGLEILQTLHAEHHTPAIGVLHGPAVETAAGREEALRLGVFDLLTRPFEPAQLVEMVDLFFSQRAAASGTPATSWMAVAGPSEDEVFRPVLDTQRARFTLWGTRGSTPTPGARFLRAGGNTSCLAVESGDELFIFDAGSGIRELGIELLTQPPRKVHLFITHTHWDHIQGFPFFAPAYVPGYEIMIYGAEGFGKDLKAVFRGQLDREYFPVQMEDMNANLDFRHLTANPLPVGSAKVAWEFAQHPGATVGYKIEIAGKKIAWVPDNEFLQGYTGSPAAITRNHPLALPYGRMIDFLADADVVIHEAQYTPDEYPKKIAWGHSSVANACALMKLADVPRWVITHHDPMHDDAALEAKLNLTRQILEQIGHPIPVVHGYDGRTEFF